MVCTLPAIASRIWVEQPYSDSTKKIIGKITLVLGAWDDGSVGKALITQAWGPQLIPRTHVKIWVCQWVPVISVLERDRQEESWGCWPVNIDKAASSKFSEGLFLKILVGKGGPENKFIG